ncbi:uncharacterized protein LOC116182631 [Photinus pyralis]|nr:uncharacterized protein LOC116182631 [Photinus pyralis]
MSFSQMHQVMLPAKHPLTDLIIKHEHHRNLHAGAQSVLASLRQNYWIINGRQSVRKILRRCITCFRAKPNELSQLMGQLPQQRVTQNRIFSKVGVDYAGPYDIKDGKTRNRKIVKSYICLFVCLCTKAVHVELVGDLTALAFLNALKRFVSRRGVCTSIFSDNATNFIGANNFLKDIHSHTKVKNYISANKIVWNFIPARSPHFGGLWEASVKNLKHYIKRLTNQTNLTFEEFYTFIVQVEAILNSRPVTPLSSDPNDFEPLTPGHFLIGAPLNSLPQEEVMDRKFSVLSKYFQIQQMVQHFWHRWSQDYINTLQQRTKWKFVKNNEDLLMGSLVILKEDNQPPCKWAMGRITGLHRGSDDIVRAVSVKTQNSETKRAINKVCLLPV